MNQEQLKQQLTAWRHHLHANPESAFEEVKTAQFIAEKLQSMGIEVHRDIGKTGLVGVLKCGEGQGVIAIRADIDAIQLTEKGEMSYRSDTPERMHGCGHDGHTCIALGRRSCCYSGRISTAPSALSSSQPRSRVTVRRR